MYHSRPKPLPVEVGDVRLYDDILVISVRYPYEASMAFGDAMAFSVEGEMLQELKRPLGRTEEIESFLRWMNRRYKPKTIYVYAALLNDVDRKREELNLPRPVGAFQQFDLGKMQAKVEAEGEKKWLVLTSVLKTFYKWRGRTDLMTALSPEKYAVKHSEPVWLEDGEVKRIIDAAKTSQDRAMLQTAYDLALRCTEVTLLDKASINWKDRTILVQREKSHRELYKLHELQASEKTLMMLRLYLNERGDDEEPALFIRRGEWHGKPRIHRIDSQTVQRVFMNAMEAAGVPEEEDGRKVTFHSFARHSRLTHLAMEGIRRQDPKLSLTPLATFAGHARTDTTLMYIHIAGKALGIGF